MGEIELCNCFSQQVVISVFLLPFSLSHSHLNTGVKKILSSADVWEGERRHRRGKGGVGEGSGMGGVFVLFLVFFSHFLSSFSLKYLLLTSTCLLTTLCPSGLWFDLDVSYSGSFLMTLETKMNLIRLGREGEGLRVGEYGKDG